LERPGPVTALIVILLLSPASAPATGGLRLENERFVIRYSPDDGSIAAEIARESPAIRERILADIGIDLPGRTEVRIAPTLEAFQADQPGKGQVPLWAAGTAYPEDNLIVLRSPRAVKGSRGDPVEVFTHEFCHIALGRALGGRRIPRWLDEGFAIYEAREWRLFRYAVLAEAALTDRLIPLRVLTESFPEEADRAELAYAESFLFVSFLIQQLGREPFHRLIREYARFGDLDGAIRRAAGLTPAELEKRWVDYLKLRVSWIPVLTSVSTLWFAMALIFICGYLRKRRQARQRLAEMAREEAREGTGYAED
jgi:hypothetical protein